MAKLSALVPVKHAGMGFPSVLTPDRPHTLLKRTHVCLRSHWRAGGVKQKAGRTVSKGAEEEVTRSM